MKETLKVGEDISVEQVKGKQDKTFRSGKIMFLWNKWKGELFRVKKMFPWNG